MESRKHYPYFRGHKPREFHYNSQFHQNNYSGDCGRFSSPANDRNINTALSYRIPFPSMSKKLSPEDVEEEERKKKLSDTANKLLSKIKIWSAENNYIGDLTSSESSEQTINNIDSNFVPEQHSTNNTSRGHGVENNFSESHKKTNSSRCRIAHSFNKSKLSNVKKLVKKVVKNTGRVTPRDKQYDVNKASVKDFQNRIQHKLINEIMQMPKENLQNMLNNPTINPLMQVKISHLVRENRLLIAQKLRTLAESKMSTKDCTSNSQFLVDIDKLIDPVIETDLSVLPYDLIKQMENIFQVQFDHSEIRAGVEEESHSKTENEITTCLIEEMAQNDMDVEEILDVPSDMNEAANDCSYASNAFMAEVTNTSELKQTINCDNKEEHNNIATQEEMSELNFGGGKSGIICGNMNETISNEDQTMYECSTDEDDVKDSEENEFTPIKLEKYSNFINQSDSKIDFGVSSTFIKDDSSKDHKPFVNQTSHSSAQTSHLHLINAYCQTEHNSKSVSTQTAVQPPIFLYGVPLPQEAQEETSAALLREVNSIQNVMNKLNERRFLIFLKLARNNPHGDFLTNSYAEVNFIESITNGNMCLMDKIKEFFKNTRGNTCNSFRSRNCKHKKQGGRKKKRFERTTKN